MTKHQSRPGRDRGVVQRRDEQSNWYGIQVDERPRTDAQAIQKPKRSKGCTICLRITLGLCVGGAAVGCCLLVAGGIYKQHSGHIKILMYIGILVFLVSVVLLVILCSSWGTGGDRTPAENFSQCTCRLLTKKVKRQKGMPLNEHINQHHDSGVNPREAETSMTAAVHSSESAKKSKKSKIEVCSVKNCVCRLQTDNNSGITYRSDFPLNGNNGSTCINMYEGLQLSSSSSSPFVFNVLSRKVVQDTPPPPPPGSCDNCHHFCQSRKFSGEKIYLYNGYPYFEIQEIPNENEPFTNGDQPDAPELSSKL